MAWWECLKMHKYYNCKTIEDGSYCKLDLDLFWFSHVHLLLKQLRLESCDFARSFFPYLTFLKSKTVSQIKGWGEDCHSHASCSSDESCCLCRSDDIMAREATLGPPQSSFCYLYCKAEKCGYSGPASVSDVVIATQKQWPRSVGTGQASGSPLHLFDLNLWPPKTQQWGGLGCVLQSCLFVFLSMPPSIQKTKYRR